MSSPPPLAYPAEYYYPEFIDNHPDDPRKSPPSHLPFTTSVDNGIGSTSKNRTNLEYTNETTNKTKAINKKKPSHSLALDVVTDQGLPGTDITQLSKIDPNKNLLRNPVEKNIPKLIVDENVIKQAVRTPKIITTNLDDNWDDRTKSNQINNGQKSIPNAHINGDRTTKSKGQTRFIESPIKQQTIKFVEDEQPIDNYWKKEVLIDDEGVVHIEPVKYDRNTYEGPFGLTRKGSLIFYIGLAIFTVLAGVFLIMTGVFYSGSYPDSSTNTAKLAGIGICALSFYLGLQLILIGLWHQKFRAENPITTTTKKTNKHDDSAAHLRSSMENDNQYDYSYQQQPDYTPYENYSAPPYVSNVNEQMLYQQPDASYYDPTVWPSNVEIEGQPDPKFLQPMDWTYGQQQQQQPPPANEMPSQTTTILTSIPDTMNNKPAKKSHRHHHKKTIEAEPPKAKFDNLFPNSTVTETPLPTFSKAPETTELMKSIAEMERASQLNTTNRSSTKKNANRVKPVDDGSDVSSLNDRHQHRRHSHHHRKNHHNHGHHRRHSYSSCSTCSNQSVDEFHSDIGYNHRYHYQSQYSEPVTRNARRRTPSPPRTNRTTYRDSGHEKKRMRDSDVSNDLEDVPNVRDNRLEQIPVVRRTIIVEPYPAPPTSQITITPRTNMNGNSHVGKNQTINEDGETIMYPSAGFMNKKSKKKKKITAANDSILEDLQLEDVNESDGYDNSNVKSKKKQANKISSNKSAKNAFYN